MTCCYHVYWWSNQLINCCSDRLPVCNPLLECNANVQEKSHWHTLNMQGNPQCCVKQEHELLDLTKLQLSNMDHSYLVLWTGKVRSLWWFWTQNLSSDHKEYVWKMFWLHVKKTYIDNGECVVDVVACFNCVCIKRKSRCLSQASDTVKQ